MRPSASSPIRPRRWRPCSPATSTSSRDSPELQALAQFKNDPRFQVLIGGTEGKTILAMNNKKPPLDDLKVRQAIAYAIDRKAIIDGAMDGLGTPIGSHLTPNDPGYVDLTGMYPHDPAKAKALLKEAGVTTPLAAQPHPAAAGLCPSGRTDHRGRTGGGRHQREDPGGRMGAVALGRLQGQELRPDHRQPCRAARHRHLRQSQLLLPIRQSGVPGHQREDSLGAQPRRPQGGARRSAEEDRGGLRQCLPVPVSERDRGGREAEGPVEERADLRQRSFRHFVAMRRIGDRARAAVPPVGSRAPERLPVAQAVAGRGDGLGDRACRSVRAAYRGDLSLSAGARARGGPRLRGALAQGRADRSARRRAGDGQGQYRHPRRSEAGRRRGKRNDAGTGRRAAGRAAARSRRDPLRQDHHARLRHAVLGPLELSCARAQSVEARPQSGRLVGGRRRGGGGALWAASCRHRHRRLDPPAGRLVRHFRPEAERRPRADRPALYRPRRRPDDARRRGRGADDGDAFAARRARLFEPQI